MLYVYIFASASRPPNNLHIQNPISYKNIYASQHERVTLKAILCLQLGYKSSCSKKTVRINSQNNTLDNLKIQQASMTITFKLKAPPSSQGANHSKLIPKLSSRTRENCVIAIHTHRGGKKRPKTMHVHETRIAYQRRG